MVVFVYDFFGGGILGVIDIMGGDEVVLFVMLFLMEVVVVVVEVELCIWGFDDIVWLMFWVCVVVV